MPKASLEFVKTPMGFQAQIKTPNLRKEQQIDPEGKISVVYDSRYEKMFGCRLQVFAPTSKQHFNLIVDTRHQVDFGAEDAAALAREISRSAICRREVVYTLSDTILASNTQRSKKIRSVVCTEHAITLTYCKQTVDIVNDKGIDSRVVVSGRLGLRRKESPAHSPHMGRPEQKVRAPVYRIFDRTAPRRDACLRLSAQDAQRH